MTLMGCCGSMNILGIKLQSLIRLTQTLTRYWIPTQDSRWGQCIDPKVPCGIANALQFSVGQGNNNVWFSEWSENKIGMINASRASPISVSASPAELTFWRGQSNLISKSKSKQFQIQRSICYHHHRLHAMEDSSRNSDLLALAKIKLNLTKAGDSKEVSYIFTVPSNLKPGQYVQTVGADMSPLTVLKAIRINII